MTKGLKAWLWVVVILNAITAISTVAGAAATSVALAQIGRGDLVPLLYVSAVLSVVAVVGAILILFQQKKLGLWILIGGSVVSMILSIIIGNSVITAAISGAGLPLITYLLMRSTWEQFQ